MIRTIDHSNQDLFRTTLDQLFRLRHDCFVKERGWQEFEKDGAHERDQFDDQHAVYLAALEGEEVVGCLRLYPTSRPHMLSEVFPHLVDGEVPRSRRILEMSRLAIKPEKRRGDTYHELLIGVQEYCIRHGIDHVTSIVRALRMPGVQKLGYTLVPLGSIHDIAGDATVAIRFETGVAALERIRARTGFSAVVMEEDRVLEKQSA